MPLTILVGSQWGDEGKGKATDLLAGRLPRAARWLLAPTGGLSLLAPQVLIADAPQAATLLLADKGERFRRHWTAPMLPTIWLAAVTGYATLRGRPLRLLPSA